MQDSPELRLELLKIAASVTGSHAALMRTVEKLRGYVLSVEAPPTLIDALNQSRAVRDD